MDSVVLRVRSVRTVDRYRFVHHAIAWTLLGVLSSACRSPSGSFDLWVTDGETNQRKINTNNPLADVSLRSHVEFSAAISEVVSFQFAVRASKRVPKMQLRVTPLRSTRSSIDPTMMEVFRVHPVEVGPLPGWHIRSIAIGSRKNRTQDVLVPVRAPIGGWPAIFDPAQIYNFWVDVTIPKATSPGIYRGRIEIVSNDEPYGAVAIQLTVLPFVLPGMPTIPIIVEVDHVALLQHHIKQNERPVPVTSADRHDAIHAEQMDDLLFSTLRVLHRHRLSPSLPKLAPRVTVSARGGPIIDWTGYDAIARPILDGSAFFDRLPVTTWPVPTRSVMDSLRDTRMAPGNDVYKMAQSYLNQCAEHFESNRWLDRSYMRLAGTRNRSRSGSDMKTTADGLDLSRFSVLIDDWPQNMTPLGWPGDHPPESSLPVTGWITPAQFFDPVTMQQERAKGKSTWLTVDRPPFSGSLSIHAPPAFIRILSWQAFRLGAQRLDIGAINDWPPASSNPTPAECNAIDSNLLLYPGRRFGLAEPVPSVRLKHLRRSAQDSALCALLNRHGLKEVVDHLTRRLAPYCGSSSYRAHFADGRTVGWAPEAQVFDLARGIMVDKMLELIEGSPTDPIRKLKVKARRRRFDLATQRIHLNVDGIRVRPATTHGARAFEATCYTTIENQSDLPIAGMLRADLPHAQWNTQQPSITQTIPPGKARRVLLKIAIPGTPAVQTGNFPIDFALDDSSGSVVRQVGRLSFLTAVATAVPIQVDGDLSDWPLGAVNIASDFLSIAPPASDTDPKNQRKPPHRTRVFILRDEKKIYFGIHCELGRPLDDAPHRNVVDYDDLIPTGGELVELLLDPTNAGTRSPDDLFRIVVKPSGSYITERGIKTTPPCGRRTPWAADIIIGTKTHRTHWTAEISIPISSFDVDTDSNVVWGFNIARFDLWEQAFSTWSGALGNAYDPLAMGNLYLP